MILPKDIFATTKGYIKFLIYLYSEKTFTVEKLSLEFNISKWVLYKQVKYWEKQNYVSIVAMVGKKGGKQYQYRITKDLSVILKDFLLMLKHELL